MVQKLRSVRLAVLDAGREMGNAKADAAYAAARSIALRSNARFCVRLLTSDVRPLDQTALTLLELLRFPPPVQRLPPLQPHLDAALGHVMLGLRHGVFTKVENAGRQHGVGQAFGDTFHQMIEIAHTTRGNNRYRHRF